MLIARRIGGPAAGQQEQGGGETDALSGLAGLAGSSQLRCNLGTLSAELPLPGSKA